MRRLRILLNISGSPMEAKIHPKYKNLTIEGVGRLLKSVFDILWFAPNGLYLSQILEYLVNNGKLTEYDLGYFDFSPKIRRFEAMIRIGITPLVKAGWLDKNNDGLMIITEKGRANAKRFSSPEEFFSAAVNEYDGRKTEIEKPNSITTSLLRIEAEVQSLEQIQTYIKSLEIRDIKYLLTSLLISMGYYIVWDAREGKSRGMIDMIVCKEPFPVKNNRVFVHISHTGQPVTIEGVRSFTSAIPSQEQGLNFSTSGFTPTAYDGILESKYGVFKPLNLVEFIDLWRQYYSKLEYEAVQMLPLKPIYFLNRDC